ncbi:MAG: MerR family transcriptional regulator [Candidatus Babeliales bacterium]
MKRKKGYFSISAVAKMFSVHQQTIRLYEKEGLITPKRSDGNTRLFSEEDVDKLEQVIYLTHELGINLAGVEMVMRLQKQIKKLQKEINSAFAATQDELGKQEELYKNSARSSAQRLRSLKEDSSALREKQSSKTVQKQKDQSETKESQPIDLAEWHVDYEE